MELQLFFAGTGGAAPTARRGLPAVLLRAGGDRILFDCGEGTQRQLLQSVGLPDIDAVFITHYHADHWLGLPGILKTFDLRARDKPLDVHGPPGLKQLWSSLAGVVGRTRYPLRLHELERFDEVDFGSYGVQSFPNDHRLPGFGYAIVEDARPGRFDPEEAVRLGVRPGPDFGRLQAGETVDGVRPEQVIGETRRGRRIVLSGDTRPCMETEEHARDADVLVHEATFTESERDRARETGHSTAQEAAGLARDAGVRLLALTHLSMRYFPREIRDEARAVFADTVVPRDFDAIDVPFPERGAPALVRAEPEASSDPPLQGAAP
jgi:ribonuclease Z